MKIQLFYISNEHGKCSPSFHFITYKDILTYSII